MEDTTALQSVRYALALLEKSGWQVKPGLSLTKNISVKTLKTLCEAHGFTVTKLDREASKNGEWVFDGKCTCGDDENNFDATWVLRWPREDRTGSMKFPHTQQYADYDRSALYILETISQEKDVSINSLLLQAYEIQLGN